MAKRGVHDHPLSEEGSDSDDLASRARKRSVRGGSSKSAATPVYRASIEAIADASAIATAASSGGGEADEKIVERIKKCLARAHHPGTPDAEAKAALHLASRLMSQYNMTQAEVLAHEPPEVRQQYAGQSVVAIERSDGNYHKRVFHQTYVDGIVEAICTFFDCKSYTTKYSAAFKVTFFGIGQNTTAAAYSFEMVYNQVNDWALRYKGRGPRNSYFLGAAQSLVRMARREREEEGKRALQAETAKLAARVKEEEQERQAQLERLNQPLDGMSSPELHAKVEEDPDIDESRLAVEKADSDASDEFGNGVGAFGIKFDPEASHDGNTGAQAAEADFEVDDDETIDASVELDEMIKRLVKSDPEEQQRSNPWSVPLARDSAQSEGASLGRSLDEGKESKDLESERNGGEGAAAAQPSENETSEDRTWASHMQLVTFRDTAAKIADAYIEQAGIKLHRRLTPGSTIQDEAAYQRGKEDGRKIDVRRRRIGD